MQIKSGLLAYAPQDEVAAQTEVNNKTLCRTLFS